MPEIGKVSSNVPKRDRKHAQLSWDPSKVPDLGENDGNFTEKDNN